VREVKVCELSGAGRRAIVAALAVLCSATGIVACGGNSSGSGGAQGGSGSSAKGLTTVTFETDYLPNGKYVPFAYGLEKGYFRQEGINLQMKYGRGSGLTAQAVATGKVDIGMVDSGVLALAVSKGAPLKSVGVYLGKNDFAFFVPNDSPTTSISQLAGKRVITAPGTPQSIVSPAVLRLAGLGPGAVHFQYISPALAVSTYAHGKGDAIGETVNFAQVFAKARPSRPLAWANVGYVVPGFSFVVSTKTLSAHRDVVARFLKATYKSEAAALADPQDASAAYAKANPTLPKDTVAASWKSVAPYVCSNSAVSANSPIGYQQADVWSKAVGILRRSAGLPKSVKASSLYTNEFFSRDHVSSAACGKAVQG